MECAPIDMMWWLTIWIVPNSQFVMRWNGERPSRQESVYIFHLLPEHFISNLHTIFKMQIFVTGLRHWSQKSQGHVSKFQSRKTGIECSRSLRGVYQLGWWSTCCGTYIGSRQQRRCLVGGCISPSRPDRTRGTSFVGTFVCKLEFSILLLWPSPI